MKLYIKSILRFNNYKLGYFIRKFYIMIYIILLNKQTFILFKYHMIKILNINS